MAQFWLRLLNQIQIEAMQFLKFLMFDRIEYKKNIRNNYETCKYECALTANPLTLCHEIKPDELTYHCNESIGFT